MDGMGKMVLAWASNTSLTLDAPKNMTKYGMLKLKVCLFGGWKTWNTYSWNGGEKCCFTILKTYHLQHKSPCESVELVLIWTLFPIFPDGNFIIVQHVWTKFPEFLDYDFLGLENITNIFVTHQLLNPGLTILVLLSYFTNPKMVFLYWTTIWVMSCDVALLWPDHYSKLWFSRKTWSTSHHDRFLEAAQVTEWA